MAPKLYLMHMSPPCRSILMVAKAIGLELELEEVERHHLKNPEMLELNPTHTVPILVDDDFTIWESHAIATYLVGKYAENDSLYPADLQKRAIIDNRLHFDNGTLYPRGIAAVTPFLLGMGDIDEEAKDKLLEAYGFLEEFLNGQPWLTGEEITIADLAILATMSTAELLVPVDEDRFPLITDWLHRCKSLEYFDEANGLGLAKTKEYIEMAAPSQ